MTFLYNTSHENEHLISELENQNGNANIANIASNEISFQLQLCVAQYLTPPLASNRVHLFVVGSFHLSIYTLQRVNVGRAAKTQGYKLRSTIH